MTDTLLGRLVLVTGAGRGNGAAIARGLAAAGAEVIVTDIDKDAAHTIAESIVKQGGRARGFALDVTDAKTCTKLAEDVALLVGPIRILVNNAGIFLRGNLVAPDGRERWDKTMAVNVQGPFNVTRAFVEQLKLTKGTIVNAHKDLDDEQCRAFDARLILLLVNHIGDEAVIREALKEARP